MSNTITHRGAQPNIIQSEPVVTAAVSAVLVKGIAMAVEFGAPITEGQADAIDGFSTALMVAIFLVVRIFVTPKSKVVEQMQDGHVFAGEASELPTGTPIREIGDLQVADSPDLDPNAEA